MHTIYANFVRLSISVDRIELGICSFAILFICVFSQLHLWKSKIQFNFESTQKTDHAAHTDILLSCSCLIAWTRLAQSMRYLKSVYWNKKPSWGHIGSRSVPSAIVGFSKFPLSWTIAWNEIMCKISRVFQHRRALTPFGHLRLRHDCMKKIEWTQTKAARLAENQNGEKKYQQLWTISKSVALRRPLSGKYYCILRAYIHV